MCYFLKKFLFRFTKQCFYCSHLNLKPPPLSKIFSQGYVFHLGNYLSTTAPDPFNAKANEKGPRTRPWCTPKKVHTYNKECTLPLSLLWRLWQPLLIEAHKEPLTAQTERERDCQVHHKHAMKHKETQQDRCERECVRVRPQLHVLVHLL